jgi:hypothetical protein
MLDILTQAAVDTAPIHIKGANGEHLYFDGKPVRIVIYGPGSTAAAEVEDRQTARAIKRMTDNDGKFMTPPMELRDAEAAEDLASITVSFENLAYSAAGDKTGKDLFRAVYSDKKLGFIAQQIQKARADWGNFKPG